VLIPPTDYVQNLKILNFFTPLPIYFQLNLNTNTEHVSELTQQFCLQRVGVALPANLGSNLELPSKVGVALRLARLGSPLKNKYTYVYFSQHH